MSKNKKSKYKRLKRTHFVGTIIEFLVFTILFLVVLIFSTSIFIHYILDSKLSTEYETIRNMAEVYEQDKNDKKVYDLLEISDRDYIITDASGEVVHQRGENTCSFDGDDAKVSESSNRVLVYKDTQRPFIYPNKSGALSFDFVGFRKWMVSSDENEVYEDASEKIFDAHSMTQIETSNDKTLIIKIDDKGVEENRIIRFPLWLSVDVNGGKEHFVGKAMITVSMKDLELLAEILVLVVFLIIVILIVLLVNGIISIVRQRRLVNIYFEDEITKGNNWMHFLIKGDQKLRKRCAAKKRFAVVSLVFKNYRNYVLCHSKESGEALLCKIYDTIFENLDKSEMVSHTSASNFALLLNVEDEDKLNMRLHELITKLQSINTDHVFTFQAGVDFVNVETNDRGYIVKRRNVDIETTYNNASTAKATMNDTDESGIRVFDNKLVEEQKWLDIVQEKQWTALRNEEFLVYYQPKYDPRTNTLKGAEALIRWESPEYGFVTPGRIIPIFEKNGFITEIDHYMISHVARDQKKWLDEGKRVVPVSVNVSRAHFVESDLAEQIRDMIDKEGCPHNLVEIELTESAFFDDKKAMIETIKKLKAFGFAVSMDDFGAGYSSLNSLKDMPLDVLKLDAEFFRGKAEGDRGEIVVTEAIKLAKSLNMRTVAEGVEEKEQVDFLAQQGCDMIQGYYFAKPMPKKEFEERMN